MAIFHCYVSVPLKPMVLLIIIPFLNGYFIGNIPYIFRQTQILILEYLLDAYFWDSRNNLEYILDAYFWDSR